jgi:hypothetical protein
VCFSGCRALHPGSLAETVDGTHDEVFEATLDVLEERRFPIETANRADGHIATGRRAARLYQPRYDVEKVEVRIREKGTQTHVRLLLSFAGDVSERPRRAPRNQNTSRRSAAFWNALSESSNASLVYDHYLDAIEARVVANRRAKEDAR